VNGGSRFTTYCFWIWRCKKYHIEYRVHFNDWVFYSGYMRMDISGGILHCWLVSYKLHGDQECKRNECKRNVKAS
jgi:hypothetical protein